MMILSPLERAMTPLLVLDFLRVEDVAAGGHALGQMHAGFASLQLGGGFHHRTSASPSAVPTNGMRRNSKPEAEWLARRPRCSRSRKRSLPALPLASGSRSRDSPLESGPPNTLKVVKNLRTDSEGDLLIQNFHSLFAFFRVFRGQRCLSQTGWQFGRHRYDYIRKRSPR